MSNIGVFSTKTNKSLQNQEIRDDDRVGRIIKTLSKAKKSKHLAKFKKSTKAKKPEFAIIIHKASRTDFLTFRAKIAFLYIMNNFY